MTESFRYAAAEVDTTAKDLPALKAEFIVEEVPDGVVLIDVGCGGGKMLRTIRNCRPGIVFHGCDVKIPADVDNDFIFTPVDPTTGRLPYDDASADVLLVIDVLEHVENPHQMLDELHRILRPDGRLIAFIPIEGERVSWYAFFRWFLGPDLYARTKDHIRAFSHCEVDAMLGQKFEVERREYAYHFLGNLMDAALFAAVSIEPLRRAFWQYSPYHGGGDDRQPSRSLVARGMRTALCLANMAAWAESRLLRDVRAGSAGQLISARRR